MTDVKHTPGPWVILGEDTIEGEEMFEISRGQCGTSEFVSIGYIRDSVDANLTVAAPDLLDALEHAREYLAQNCASDDRSNNVRAIVYAAIAKAKGAPHA